MRYIAIGVDTSLFAEEINDEQFVLIVDTESSQGGNQAIARVLGVHAALIANALNASVEP